MFVLGLSDALEGLLVLFIFLIISAVSAISRKLKGGKPDFDVPPSHDYPESSEQPTSPLPRVMRWEEELRKILAEEPETPAAPPRPPPRAETEGEWAESPTPRPAIPPRPAQPRPPAVFRKPKPAPAPTVRAKLPETIRRKVVLPPGMFQEDLNVEGAGLEEDVPHKHLRELTESASAYKRASNLSDQISARFRSIDDQTTKHTLSRKIIERQRPRDLVNPKSFHDPGFLRGAIIASLVVGPPRALDY